MKTHIERCAEALNEIRWQIENLEDDVKLAWDKLAPADVLDITSQLRWHHEILERQLGLIAKDKVQ